MLMKNKIKLVEQVSVLISLNIEYDSKVSNNRLMAMCRRFTQHTSRLLSERSPARQNCAANELRSIARALELGAKK
jgi:hypothetical protein